MFSFIGGYFNTEPIEYVAINSVLAYGIEQSIRYGECSVAVKDPMLLTTVWSRVDEREQILTGTGLKDLLLKLLETDAGESVDAAHLIEVLKSHEVSLEEYNSFIMELEEELKTHQN